MTTKFYQINGVWNTYQYWHDNYGYTTEPTQSMSFKSSASGTWGTNVNPGYFTSPGGYTIDNWSFWSNGIVGWKDIDQLALAGAYPATAIDVLLERNGTIANAVYVDDSDQLYYLIDGYLSDGWRPWNEVEADGWQVYEGNPPYYMVVNETTGEIVYSISETEENPSMVFSQVGHIEMPDSEMITVYETGVPVQSFYFTANGRNETENTDISHSTIPVYFEDGTAPAADTPYDGSPVLAFMDVDGNTKAADGESLYLDDGVLMLDAPDTDEGEQWSALVEYIEPVPPAPTELTAYFTNQGSAATGDSNLSYGSYTMYDSSGQTISTQSGETYALIAKFNKAGIRVPIYPLAPYGGDYLRQLYGFLLFETVTSQNVFRVIYNIGLYAYFTTTGATESANTSIGNSRYDLYNSNGDQVSYDSSKTYTIKAIYDIDGNRVLNVGNSYFTSYLGKLEIHGDSETFLTYDAYIIVYTTE